MLTIFEIRTNAQKVFARQSEEAKTANIAILNYIDHMGKNTGVNINAWDIATIFGDPANKKQSLELIKDRNTINKIFFAQMDKLKSEPNGDTDKVTALIRTNLEKISTARKATRLKALDQDIKYRMNDLDQTIRRTMEYIASISKMKKEVAELQGGNSEDKIIADIEDILKGNFFEFLEIHGNDIVFTTKNDIINTLIKPSAGINLKVNLGKFRIIFNMSSLAIQVRPHKDNTQVDGIFHPHVNGNGNVCWGDASDHASKLALKFDIKNLMLLLATLLSTYNEQNPYVSLHTFSEVQKAKQANQELPF